jgi:hypothetical protein
MASGHSGTSAVLESVHSNDVEDHAVVIDQEGRSQRRFSIARLDLSRS